MDDAPFTNGQNGFRDTAGRFKKDWRGGPGKPVNRYAIKFSALVDEVFDEVVSKERLTVAVSACMSAAEQGDLQCLREILARLKGPPQPVETTIRMDAFEETQKQIVELLERTA